MAKRPPSPGQMALPLDRDLAWMQLAEEEAERTVASAANDLRAAELIRMVTGMSFEEAEAMLKKAGGVHKLAQLPDYALATLVDLEQARKIRAMTDWGLVLNAVDSWQSVQVHAPVDVANLVMLEMSLLDHEQLRVVGLDTKNWIVDKKTVYSGSLNRAVVRLSEVMRLPIALQCAGMILIHNHPSGDPTPSPEDVHITNLVRESAQMLDIDLLDHLIIGRNRFVSMKERGLGFG
jgi:DNA repair protein RadC